MKILQRAECHVNSVLKKVDSFLDGRVAENNSKQILLETMERWKRLLSSLFPTYDKKIPTN